MARIRGEKLEVTTKRKIIWIFAGILTIGFCAIPLLVGAVKGAPEPSFLYWGISWAVFVLMGLGTGLLFFYFAGILPEFMEDIYDKMLGYGD